jgi:hypothetical protein
MKRVTRICKVGALGALAVTGLTACLVGATAAAGMLAMWEGSTSPAAMSTAAGDPAIMWGLRAATSTARADERRPRFRMSHATAVAMTIVTAAQRGTDSACQQGNRRA